MCGARPQVLASHRVSSSTAHWMFIGRAPARAYIDSRTPGAWLAVDLRRWSCKLTHYTLRAGPVDAEPFRLRRWQLQVGWRVPTPALYNSTLHAVALNSAGAVQGSKDGLQWTVLHHRTPPAGDKDDGVFAGHYQTKTWAVNPEPAGGTGATTRLNLGHYTPATIRSHVRNVWRSPRMWQLQGRRRACSLAVELGPRARCGPRTTTASTPSSASVRPPDPPAPVSVSAFFFNPVPTIRLSPARSPPLLYALPHFSCPSGVLASPQSRWRASSSPSLGWSSTAPSTAAAPPYSATLCTRAARPVARQVGQLVLQDQVVNNLTTLLATGLGCSSTAQGRPSVNSSSARQSPSRWAGSGR
jgi:hypothetical protein